MPSPPQIKNIRNGYCWECECTAWSALCSSCASHRADGHAPRHIVIRDHIHDRRFSLDELDYDGDYRHSLIAFPRPPMGCRDLPSKERCIEVVQAWYCHGAGPSGTLTSRLRQEPRLLDAPSTQRVD